MFRGGFNEFFLPNRIERFVTDGVVPPGKRALRFKPLIASITFRQVRAAKTGSPCCK